MTNYFNSKEQYLTFRKAWANASQNKLLDGGHYAMFNLLMKRPIERGFTPITNVVKLQNGFSINHGLAMASNHLRSMINTAKQDKPASWMKYRLECFLAPFDGAIPIEMIKQLPDPQIMPLYTDFGKGKQMANMIIERKLTQITFKDLEDLYEAA